MSVAWPWKPPWGWWMRMRLLGSAERLPLRAAGQQQRAHRHRDPAHRRGDVGLDEAHRVVDRQPGVDDPARRVDVELDVLLGILGLEVQQLRHDEVGDVVVDRGADEHDALAQQPRVDVERALSARVLLDDHRHQGHVQPPSCVFRRMVAYAQPTGCRRSPDARREPRGRAPRPARARVGAGHGARRDGDLARRGRRVRARGGRAAADRRRARASSSTSRPRSGSSSPGATRWSSGCSRTTPAARASSSRSTASRTTGPCGARRMQALARRARAWRR